MLLPCFEGCENVDLKNARKIKRKNSSNTANQQLFQRFRAAVGPMTQAGCSTILRAVLGLISEVKLVFVEFYYHFLFKPDKGKAADYFR